MAKKVKCLYCDSEATHMHGGYKGGNDERSFYECNEEIMHKFTKMNLDSEIYLKGEIIPGWVRQTHPITRGEQ